MSEYKAGDRVRVIIEGTVTSSVEYVDRLYIDSGSAMRHAVTVGSGVTIEKLPDPLPTTPGSVLLGRHNCATYTLGTDGRWYTPAMMGNGLTGRTLTAHNYGDWDIIYDAGKTS